MPPQSRGKRRQRRNAAESKSSDPSSASTANNCNIKIEQACNEETFVSSSQGHSQLGEDESTGQSEPLSPQEATTEHDMLPQLTALGPSDEESSDDDDDSGEGDGIKQSQRLQNSNSNTDLRPMSSAGLFPPFYNRPPTPLPPSPSFTSLLRPSFSTQNSRPTTPDSSDVEGILSRTDGSSTPLTSSTAAAVAKSARTATTVPRASPKIPTYEYYGFAVYLASSAAFLMYLLWAFLPSTALHWLGIHYYPNRWWAVAIPAWLVVAVLWIYVALAAYNVENLTLRVDSIENLVDEAAQIAVLDREGLVVQRKAQRGESGVASGGKGEMSHAYDDLVPGEDGIGPCGEEVGRGRDWKALWNEGTDAVMDVPIGGVCEILFGDGELIEGDSGEPQRRSVR